MACIAIYVTKALYGSSKARQFTSFSSISRFSDITPFGIWQNWSAIVTSFQYTRGHRILSERYFKQSVYLNVWVTNMIVFSPIRHYLSPRLAKSGFRGFCGTPFFKICRQICFGFCKIMSFACAKYK